MGVVALALNCAKEMAVRSVPRVNEVSAFDGLRLNVPAAVSPVPAGVLPVLKSLSLTCASVPATVPSVRPVIATRSLTAVMLKVSVLATNEMSTPPLAVPPVSCTRKPSAPKPAPLTFSAGVKVNNPALMSTTLMTCMLVIVMPLSRYTPCAAEGKLVTMTLSRVLAGASLASANPKFAAVTTVAMSSRIVTAMLAAVGASLTEITLMLTVSLSVLVKALPELSVDNMVKVSGP